MDFKTFWYDKDQAARSAFADKVDRSIGYLNLVAGGFRRASPQLAIDIDLQSEGKVTRGEVRPDIFDPPAPKPDQGRAAA